MTTARDELRRLMQRRVDGEALTSAQDRLLDGALARDQELAQELQDLLAEDALIHDALSDLSFGRGFENRIKFALQVSIHEQQKTQTRPSQRMSIPAQWQSALRFAPIAAAALLLASIFLWAPESKTQRSKGHVAVAHVKGRGLAVQSQFGWQSLKQGEGIPQSAVIRNQSLEPASLNFDNGTEVTLRGETTLALTKTRDGATEIDLRAGQGGEIFCSVEPGYGEFRVRAHDLSVTVLGTQFIVRSFPGLTRVVVIEGRVRCESANDQQVLIDSQEAELSPQRAIQVSRSDLKRRSHWLPQKPKARVTNPATWQPVEKPENLGFGSKRKQTEKNLRKKPPEGSEPEDKLDMPMGVPNGQSALKNARLPGKKK